MTFSKSDTGRNPLPASKRPNSVSPNAVQPTPAISEPPPPPPPPESKPNILYMVSDSEGCQENRDTATNNVTQSSAMCNQAFFDEITEKMTANENMKFAFLGDYFDQGPKVRQSIKGMMALHKLFNIKGQPERVFIILGNRDVNKLRFMFELNNTLTTLQKGTDNRWEMWNGYYDKLDAKQTTLGSVDHVTHILFTSMGANQDIGLTSFLPDADSAAAAVPAGKAASARAAKGKADNAFKADPSEANKSNVDTAVETLNAAEAELLPHKEKAIPFLKASFGIDGPKDGMIDVVEFFRMCKICHYDADSKSFLSHGGGWYRDAFFNQEFVDSLIAEDGAEVTAANYLSLMEKYRLKLFTGVMDPKYKATTVQESVQAYNNLLQTVRNEVSETPKKFTPKFVLLQALGLKPAPEEESKYRSVIQSCSQNGCAGISPDKFKNKGDDGVETDDNNLDDLFDLFDKSDVKMVSYGHRPICYYVPLIYQRTDSKRRKITFISNDTSNGNRPLNKLGENIVMVTSIEKTGDNNLVAKVNMFGNAYRIKIQNLHPGLLSGAEPPQYVKNVEGITQLAYNGGPIVNMNTNGNYGQLKLIQGGRRRRGTNKRRRAATRKNKVRRVNNNNNKRKSNRRVKRTRSRSRHHSRL